jgi:3-oxoacyl-[acyl-carrier protein] reductase
MFMDFRNRTAIITGAARGIGRAISLELARLGCTIAFNYSHSSDDADLLMRDLADLGVHGYCFQSNVGDYGAAEKLVREVADQCGGIDYLVNNAGIIKDKLVLRMSEQDWDDVIETNLKGAFNFSKAVSAIMLKARFGSILNITSISGIIGAPGQVNYSASKAGMIGLTKSMAKELAGRNITVNALALGLIDTDMTRKMSAEYKESIIRSIPLGRPGTVQEAAKVARFLLSDEARYITGQVIQMDGGLGM